MSKFKVGQKVIIKEDFHKIDPDHSPGIVDDMLKYAGREDKIYKVYDDIYKLESDVWSWAEEWLEEPVKEVNDSDIMSILEEV